MKLCGLRVSLEVQGQGLRVDGTGLNVAISPRKTEIGLGRGINFRLVRALHEVVSLYLEMHQSAPLSVMTRISMKMEYISSAVTLIIEGSSREISGKVTRIAPNTRPVVGVFQWAFRWGKLVPLSNFDR